jgi:ribonuclease P protein component
LLERIKSRETIGKVYSFGKTIISSDKRVKAIYYIENNPAQPTISYAVTISSKSGNSVWRNRFKRLIRESVFFEYEIINEVILSLKLNVEIVFSPAFINQQNQKKTFLADIQPAVSDIFIKLKKQVSLIKENY